MSSFFSASSAVFINTVLVEKEVSLGIYLRVSSARERFLIAVQFRLSARTNSARNRFNFAAGVFEELLRVFGIRKLIRLDTRINSPSFAIRALIRTIDLLEATPVARSRSAESRKRRQIEDKIDIITELITARSRMSVFCFLD